jgi:hypothetical protein
MKEKIENVTKSEYCIKCSQSYQNLTTCRWICRRTGEIVVGTDGRATVNAMKCN